MPLSRVQRFSDPDDYCSSVRGFVYDLTVTEGRKFTADLVRIDLHGVWMVRSSSNLPLVAHLETMKDRATFAFRVKEGPSVLLANEEVLPANIERFSNGGATYCRTSGESLWASMSLPVDALTAVGVATVGRDLAPPRDTVLETPSAKSLACLRRLHAAAGHLARTAPEVIANPEAARGLEHTLVQALVACLGPVIANEDSVATRRHALVMRRFHTAVSANGDNPIYLSDLCSEIGVSERTLLVCCHEQLGMGPRRYLRLRRMQHAHRALALADRASTTVTNIATAHGFWELGRFAVAYRSFYGETPSETLARAPDHVGSHYLSAAHAKFSETA